MKKICPQSTGFLAWIAAILALGCSIKSQETKNQELTQAHVKAKTALLVANKTVSVSTDIVDAVLQERINEAMQGFQTTQVTGEFENDDAAAEVMKQLDGIYAEGFALMNSSTDADKIAVKINKVENDKCRYSYQVELTLTSDSTSPTPAPADVTVTVTVPVKVTCEMVNNVITRFNLSISGEAVETRTQN